MLKTLTKELVYEKIREFEMDAGEDFFDQSCMTIGALTYMTWCLGKGYISSKQYNSWAKAYNSDELEAIDENYYIYNSQGGFGSSFAVVVSDDYNEEDYKKALLIFGEFVCEIEVYTERFYKFLDEESLSL